MSEFLNGDDTNDAAGDLDQRQHAHKAEDAVNASTSTVFERRLKEYHNRLAHVVREEPGRRKDS